MGFLANGGPFLVNTTTTGTQVESNVALLASGRFVVTWTDGSNTGADTSTSAVRAQIFNADGSKAGGEFLVNTTTASAQDESSVTALSDGRFVVTWTDHSGTGGDPTSEAIRGQIFNANGTKSGGEFLVNTATTSVQEDSSVTALSGGRFIVTWTDFSGTGADTNTAVRGQIFNANGTKSGGEFLVNTTTMAAQDESSVTTLSDGRFVVTWTDSSKSGGDTSGDAVRGQIFNANGTKSGGEFLVNTTTSDFQYTSSVTALADGRFVATWTDQSQTGGDTSGFAVRGQVFNANGAKSGGEFLVNTTTARSQFQNSVAALDDGRFVVTWTDRSPIPDGYIWIIKAQVFAANGAKSGSEFEVSTLGVDEGRSDSSVTALDGGRFVVTWSDSHSGIGDTDFAGVAAQIFDATNYVGVSSTGETVIGGSLADTIRSYNGHDTLLGEGGDDYLDGGASADLMRGGAGADRYVVDNAGDIVDEGIPGSNGEDIVLSSISFSLADTAHVKGAVEIAQLLGTANLNLLGNALGNRLIGNSGANVINGSLGADWMQGRGGNDTYTVDNFGDIVDETLGGSNGLDTIRSAISFSLADTIHAKGAIENLTLIGTLNLNALGNNFNNVLTGNAGANTLNGGAGADILRGGAGNDRYSVDNAADLVDESIAGSTGIDTVNSTVSFDLASSVQARGNVENVTLLGAANLNVLGNSLANVITGNAGSNAMTGRLGNDTLTGGGGNDFFLFNTALGAANVDTITDMNQAGNDTIRLENAIFTALTTTGSLAVTAFHIGAAAANASDRIVYNSVNGQLFYDSNGNATGGSTLFAILDPGLALTAADFVVV